MSVRWRFVGVAVAVAAAAAAVSGTVVRVDKPFDPARALSGAVADVVQLGSASKPNSGSVQGASGHSFTIAGSVQRLYPGAGTSSAHPVYVYLSVANPNSQAIVVTSLSYRVSNASSRCGAANLSPTTYTKSFSVRVPARASIGGTSFAMPISMVSSAGNACQGQVFPLSLTGTAVQG